MHFALELKNAVIPMRIPLQIFCSLQNTYHRGSYANMGFEICNLCCTAQDQFRIKFYNLKSETGKTVCILL